MNKQGLFGLETVKAVIIVFIFLVVIAVTLILVSFQLKETGITSNDITLTPSDTFLSDNGTSNTLTQTPSTWTSATTLNNSWLSFDGVNDVLSLSNSGAEFNYDMNFSGWVWVNISSSDMNGDIIQKGDLIVSSSETWHLSNSATDNLTWYDGTSPYCKAVSSKNLSSLGWVFVGFQIERYSNGSFINVTLYLDGNVIGYNDTCLNVTTGFDPDDNNEPLWIGDGRDQHPKTYIDELRIYNRTLTSAEILELNASGRVANSSLSSTGLVLWLPLNENSGADIHSLNQSDF